MLGAIQEVRRRLANSNRLDALTNHFKTQNAMIIVSNVTMYIEISIIVK